MEQLFEQILEPLREKMQENNDLKSRSEHGSDIVTADNQPQNDNEGVSVRNFAMNYEVEYQGHLASVSINRAGDEFDIVIGCEPTVLDFPRFKTEFSKYLITQLPVIQENHINIEKGN